MIFWQFLLNNIQFRGIFSPDYARQATTAGRFWYFFAKNTKIGPAIFTDGTIEFMFGMCYDS